MKHGIASGKLPKRKARASEEEMQPIREQIQEAQIATSFESPESSTIVRAEYDLETEQMRVYFNGHGKPERGYSYEHVDRALWLDFMQSGSKGAFFAARVRPFWTGTPL